MHCGAAHAKARIQGGSRGRKTRTRSPIRPGPVPKTRSTTSSKADAPNQLPVADFTYVQTAMGMACTAFVLDALNQAICQRRPALGALTRHSD